MDIKQNIEWELEEDNAEEALLEFRDKGYTTRRCLRCGGKLCIYDAGSGYRVWCENCDFELSVRGI